jgi:hypothetical protein
VTCGCEVALTCDACNIGTFSTQTVSYVTPVASTGTSVLQSEVPTDLPEGLQASPEMTLRLMGL